MAPRSAWRSLNISIRFGAELPPLLRHDLYPVSLARLRRWNPIHQHGAMNKPTGGLWTAPAILPKGKWRPIPRRSTWTEWCESESPNLINHGWQTRIFPDRGAPFAVIDTAADAVALYDAFPYEDNPVHDLYRKAGLEPPRSVGKIIDWQRLLNTGVAGVYLTDRGQAETRLPDETLVPSLYGWDVATVWFGRRAFTVGETRKTPPIPVDPYGLGWDNEHPRVKARRNAERISEFSQRLREDGYGPEDAGGAWEELGGD